MLDIMYLFGSNTSDIYEICDDELTERYMSVDYSSNTVLSDI